MHNLFAPANRTSAPPRRRAPPQSGTVSGALRRKSRGLRDETDRFSGSTSQPFNLALSFCSRLKSSQMLRVLDLEVVEYSVSREVAAK